MFVGFVGVDMLNSQMLDWTSAVRLGTTSQTIAKLQNEVKDGICTIYPSKTGKSMRLLGITVVRIACEDRYLVNVGKVAKGKISTSCKLPGAKRRPEDKYAEDTLHYVLQNKLTPFADYLELTWSQQNMVDQDSKSFGIPSKYLQSVNHATLPPPLMYALAPVYTPQDSKSSNSTPTPRRMSRQGLPAVMGGQKPPLEASNRHRSFTSSLSTTDHRIMVVHNGVDPEHNLYAWISDDDFNVLSGKDGDEILQGWIESLNLVNGAGLTDGLRNPDIEAMSIEELVAAGHAPRASLRTSADDTGSI
jgi:hypothetical protein